jgi:hypothetical protein
VDECAINLEYMVFISDPDTIIVDLVSLVSSVVTELV